MGAERQSQPAPTVAPSRRAPRLFPLWLLALFAGALMVAGGYYSAQDVYDYHCYALAFWRGAQATLSLPAGSCLTPLTSFSALPFHSLPVEYGPLALLTFLPPLLFPADWYNVVFFVQMTLLALGIAWLLDRYGALWAGHVWLIFALLGSWILTASRFDVAPSACVLIAILAARRGRLPWAYVALAVGTLMKLYPLALLPLLLIESWRARESQPFWRGPALFAAIVAVTEGLVVALAPATLLTPLSFMGARCVQIESVPATFASLWALARHVTPDFPYAFNSTCETTPSMAAAQLLALALGLAGIGLALALFWRRRISLGLAALLIVGSLVVGSKVFSTQYLLWLSPLVALELGADAATLVGWSALCVLTTICFPYAYNGSLSDAFNQSPYTMIQLTAGSRNLALLALGAALVWRHMRAARRAGAPAAPALIASAQRGAAT